MWPRFVAQRLNVNVRFRGMAEVTGAQLKVN